MSSDGNENVLILIRLVWELDRDRLWNEVWSSESDCAASGDGRSWSAAVPDVHRTSVAGDQSNFVGEVSHLGVQRVQSRQDMESDQIPRHDKHSARLNTGSFLQSCFTRISWDQQYVSCRKRFWTVRRARRRTDHDPESRSRHGQTLRETRIERRSSLRDKVSWLDDDHFVLRAWMRRLVHSNGFATSKILADWTLQWNDPVVGFVDSLRVVQQRRTE